MEICAEADWRARQGAHEARVDRWITPHLERRRRGVAHPVDDFLFTYYSYRPAALRRWHPGSGTALAGSGAGEFASVKGYAVTDGLARLDPALAAHHLTRTKGIRTLLASTASRPPLLGCFGLHEWAMVYRQPVDERRHSAYPLRLGSDGTDEVVESHRITCTHYDAFRFFTAPARPLNVIQPSREAEPEHDRPGCLHATMDCYKWAYTLAPYTSSELVADCFALAREIRLVDMRAAPYDLSSLEVLPIAIETAEGKAEYLTAQREFAERGAVLRAGLIDTCDQVIGAAEGATMGAAEGAQA